MTDCFLKADDWRLSVIYSAFGALVVLVWICLEEVEEESGTPGVLQG